MDDYVFAVEYGCDIVHCLNIFVFGSGIVAAYLSLGSGEEYIDGCVVCPSRQNGQCSLCDPLIFSEQLEYAKTEQLEHAFHLEELAVCDHLPQFLECFVLS